MRALRQSTGQAAGSRVVAMTSSSGFTLIEVMIAIVVVAILMAVALPAYQESIQKGRRSDAMSALMDAANRQEQYFLDYRTYTADMEDLGFGDDPMESEEGHYTVDAAACGGGSLATCYELTATPVATSPQADDLRCTSFTLTSAGVKTATGTAANQCW